MFDRKTLIILILCAGLGVQQWTIRGQANQISTVRSQLNDTSMELNHLIFVHDLNGRKTMRAEANNLNVERELLEATFKAELPNRQQRHRAIRPRHFADMPDITPMFPQLSNDLNDLDNGGGT